MADTTTLEREIDAKVDWNRYSQLSTLGIDEIALKKGHRGFVVIVTALLSHERIVILGVLSDREKETIIEFLRFIPQRLQKAINIVCCDMYAGFCEAVHEILPTAQIVIDRFHVAMHYRAAADHLRKQELVRLKKKLPDETYHQLKGHLLAFRKNPNDLKTEERKVLRLLFSFSPTLKLAYDLREVLTAIFKQQISKTTAKIKIQAWNVVLREVTCLALMIS